MMPGLRRRLVSSIQLGSAAKTSRNIGSGLIDAAAGREGHGRPVQDLEVVGEQLGGGAVLGHGELEVAVLDRHVAGVHVLVGAVNGEQPLELGDGVGVVLDPQLEHAVGPRPAGGLRP